MMNKAILIFFLFLYLSGCARVKTIGLKEASFSKRPDHIIWLQVAGLTMEQLAILRFSYSNINEKTSFESAKCISGIWSYNLFKLRPTAYEGFLSQMTGTSNINNSCKDYTHKPVWNYLRLNKLKPIVFETGVKDQNSLARSFKCGEKARDFSKDLTLYRMSSTSNPGANIFHHQEKSSIPPNGIYYDRSCKRGVCYAKSINNINYLWKKYSAVYPRLMFIIRNFELAEAMKRKDMVGLKVALDDLEKTYRLLTEEANKNGKILLLMTTAQSNRIELPFAGKKWEQFERTGKNALFKRPSLLSFGISAGASFENFCGFYDDADILQRILWAPSKQRPIFLN